ncbi:MAG TPA: metallophosphoesterase [Armatimonadota bacterium]|nr:metallophosphoesterase [Armatimonadota bacterium]
MFYLLLALLLLDCARALNAALHFLPTQVTQRPELIGICIASFCIGVVTYGAWNAWHPRTRHFDITIHKSASTLHQLHIVMASDIHLGEIVNRNRLVHLVHDINNLHPDIVLLPGDTIDENVRPFQEQHMAEVLRGIQARYGTYAVLGNHEYLGEQVNEALRALANANVVVLRDQYVKIANSFYLLGRDDRSCPRFTGKGRQPFGQLMKGIDKHLPILLMDHQPYDLEESAAAGVDLQLSGHTHHGQIFPNGLLTQKIFEVDWGYLQKGAYQVIVSCGYGTWGPPIRTGNTPELLDIMVHFLPAQDAHQSSISR